MRHSRNDRPLFATRGVCMRVCVCMCEQFVQNDGNVFVQYHQKQHFVYMSPPKIFTTFSKGLIKNTNSKASNDGQHNTSE